MPRIKPLSAAEEKRKELSARIQYFMALLNYNNKKMAELLGISERTFTERKLHSPDEFTVSELWKMERAFGCRLSDPLQRKESA